MVEPLLLAVTVVPAKRPLARRNTCKACDNVHDLKFARKPTLFSTTCRKQCSGTLVRGPTNRLAASDATCHVETSRRSVRASSLPGLTPEPSCAHFGCWCLSTNCFHQWQSECQIMWLWQPTRRMSGLARTPPKVNKQLHDLAFHACTCESVRSRIWAGRKAFDGSWHACRRQRVPAA